VRRIERKGEIYVGWDGSSGEMRIGETPQAYLLSTGGTADVGSQSIALCFTYHGNESSVPPYNFGNGYANRLHSNRASPGPYTWARTILKTR
jgi:hypothetical protein